MECPYLALGIEKSDATDENVKTAYRQKALRLHPDKGGNAEHFQKIQAAYDTLKTVTDRRKYEEKQLLRNMFANGMQNPSTVFLNSVLFADTNFSPFHTTNSTFSSFYTANEPSNMYKCVISFAESFFGCKRRVICTNSAHKRSTTIAIPRGIRTNSYVDAIGIRAKIVVRESTQGYKRVGDNLIAPTQTVSFEQVLSGAGLELMFLNNKRLFVNVPSGVGFAALRAGHLIVPNKGFKSSADLVVPLTILPPDPYLLSVAQELHESNNDNETNTFESVEAVSRQNFSQTEEPTQCPVQ